MTAGRKLPSTGSFAGKSQKRTDVKIKNVILDMGGVLVGYDPRRYFLETKGYSKEMTERLRRATMESDTWKELDRGVWSYEQVLDSFCSHDPEIADEIRRCFKDQKDVVSRKATAIPWILHIRSQGRKIYILSNYSLRAYADNLEAMDYLPYVDGGILSYREHLIKPDPEIYRLLMHRYEMAAHECVFIDDNEENVRAAQKLGIEGIVYHSQEQAEEALDRLLAE